MYEGGVGRRGVGGGRLASFHVEVVEEPEPAARGQFVYGRTYRRQSSAPPGKPGRAAETHYRKLTRDIDPSFLDRLDDALGNVDRSGQEGGGARR